MGNPLGQWLAPIALGSGMAGMYESGSQMYENGYGSLNSEGQSNAVNFAGAAGATVAGGIGTAGLGATIATGLGYGGAGTTAATIAGATTAGGAGGAGLGLGTGVAAAGALPVMATVGAGLAAGVAIGNGMNSLADSDYNVFQDEQGRGSDDRAIDSHIAQAVARGEDPTSFKNVAIGGLKGMGGQLKDVAGGAYGWAKSFF